MEVSEDLLELIKDVSKTIGKAHKSNQRQSQQWNYTVRLKNTDGSDDLSDFSIKVFARQNELDAGNFSCGILLVNEKRGGSIILSRYNGSNHENNVANHECHIHHATVESINRGDRHPEHEDTETTRRYTDLDGAFKCLREDYKISWDSPQGDIFGNSLT